MNPYPCPCLLCGLQCILCEFVQRSITENVHYTIQIASWPSLEQARIDQLDLIEEGIDAYIERYYQKEKDEIWYRVRIGNFSDKIKAQQVQKQIESISGVKSWLDIITLGKN